MIQLFQKNQAAAQADKVADLKPLLNKWSHDCNLA